MLKLGSQTGSMTNHLMSRQVIRVPEVGEGATFLSWSDRYPGTVVKVERAGKATVVTVQSDYAKRLDSNGYYTEMQTYEYTPNPDGAKSTFRLRDGKDRWEQVSQGESGRWKITGTGGIAFGYRDRYNDPCF